MTDEERKYQYSYSRLGLYETCPYAYYLKYVERLPDEENAFAKFGTFCHAILEKYFNGELELFELADYYENNFDESVDLDFPPNAYCDLGQKYYDGGYKFFSEFEGLDGYEVVGVELEFTIPLFGDYKLHGFIDLLLKDPNGDFVIVDHKSKIFRNKKEVDEYAKQLLLYSLYINNTYGTWPDRVVFNTIRNQKMVKIKFNKEKLDAAIDWAKCTIRKIEKEDEWKKNINDFFCNHICSFRSTCDKKQ